MYLSFSQQDISRTAVRLGLPDHPFVQRRIARAFDLVATNKVSQIDDGIFRVRSQYEPDKSYIVNVNHGAPYCDCPDGERTINCKHRIASLLYVRLAKEDVVVMVGDKPTSKVTWDDTENSYHKRGRWWVTDYKRKVKYIVYRDGNGRLICPCGKKKDCEHRKAIREYLNDNPSLRSRTGFGGNGSKITNECGSEHAKTLQDKMNGQLNSQNDNGNGAQAPSQPQLDISDPFQESESYDIDQIEGRRNGELAWKLSNGEYVISYAGVMKLAEKHNIEFSVSLRPERSEGSTNTVIAKAMNGNSRISGKEVKICGFATTASELAKRNAARQLIPLPEIKAIEKKVQLENEFDWQKAKAKCVELVGIEANVDIIIHELTQAGKLRQDNPSHYDRTEWLIIHSACKQDASNNGNDDNNDDGDNTPSSDNGWKEKLQECEDAAANEVRYCWIRSDLEREGIIPSAGDRRFRSTADNPAVSNFPDEHPEKWQDQDFDTLKQACALDASLFNRGIGDDWTLILETNKGVWAYERRYRFWLITKDTNELREKCFVCGKTRSQAQMTDDLIHWERYYIKTVVCADCLEATTKQDLTKRFNELYHNGNGAVDITFLPKPSEDFIRKIDDVLGKFDTATPATNKGEDNATPSERTQELPNNADDFVSECKEAVDNVNDDDSVEANEQPLEGDNGKRKLQMDKKLRTWLVETDGTKKEISCREICEKFESEKNPNIVTRLRAGIDSGADISTVELDN